MEKLNKYDRTIDVKILKKFRYITDWAGRNANKELELLLKIYIANYEVKYGEIIIDKEM